MHHWFSYPLAFVSCVFTHQQRMKHILRTCKQKKTWVAESLFSPLWRFSASAFTTSSPMTSSALQTRLPLIAAEQQWDCPNSVCWWSFEMNKNSTVFFHLFVLLFCLSAGLVSLLVWHWKLCNQEKCLECHCQLILSVWPWKCLIKKQGNMATLELPAVWNPSMANAASN